MNERRQAAERSLNAWTGVYARPHIPLVGDVCQFHIDMMTMLARGLLGRQRTIICVPREHAKTTLGCDVTCAFAAATGIKKYIQIFGANKEKAAEKLNTVVDLLQENAMIQEDYGDEVRPKIDERNIAVKNNDYAVVLNNGCLLVALGRRAKIRGSKWLQYRPDLALLDDPEDEDSAESQDESRKFATWVNDALLNSLDSDNGSLVWLGTPLYAHAYFDKIVAAEAERYLNNETGEAKDEVKPKWNKMYRRMYDPETLEFLWPQRWDIGKATWKRDDVGQESFEQNYMCNLRGNGGGVFEAEWFNEGIYYDPLRDIRLKDGAYEARNPREPEQWLMLRQIGVALDPALGLDRANDFSAFVAVGVQDATGLVYFLDIREEKITADGIVAVLHEMNEHWRPSLIGIENTIFQQLLVDKVEASGLPVWPLHAVDNKGRRIQVFARRFEQRRVMMPHPAKHRGSKRFIDQAIGYPNGRHDDLLDGGAHGMSLIELNVGSGLHRARRQRETVGMNF